jgi:protein-S-isoprenylcysteine O-methyltransferase Ste14
MEKVLLNGLILVLPILIIRFALLSLLNKDAVIRAAFFPPTKGIEKVAYWINQLTTLSLLVILFLLRIKIQGLSGFIGLGVSSLGLILYIISIIQFARPNNVGLSITGLYGISRNPMYVAYFIYFIGCCILTGSWLLLVVLIIFQISVHFLILSEERWCIDQFGETYRAYIENVRRYI